MPTRANALAVMAKAPIAGAVKTRLIPFLTVGQAAELARALLVDQLEHLCALKSIDLYLSYAPPEEKTLMRRLAPAPFALFPQSEGDLGARMQNIFAALFAQGHQKVTLIGADLLPVPLSHFAQAFAYLDQSERRAVLGPSRDGGYYLIGLNRPAPELFTQMTWSHHQVWAETMQRLTSLGVTTWQLPEWFDVDRPDDLTLVQPALALLPKQAAPNISRFLRELKSTRKAQLLR